MADAPDKEQLLNAAWARWREADYTWDGLAKKPWRGWVVNSGGYLVEAKTGRRYGADDDAATLTTKGREATLQDYWRANPATGRRRSNTAMVSELYPFPGQPTYHAAHLPMAYADGNDTQKASWPDDALDNDVNARLLAARADAPAQFQGGVWLCAAAHPSGIKSPLSLRYDGAIFSGNASFDSATFSGDAWFNSATFSGDAWFRSATFSGDAGFNSATFSGDASFNSATFSGHAGFHSATFSGDASFNSATFSGHAGFNSATFSGDASFESAAFCGPTSLRNTVFERTANFDGRAAELSVAAVLQPLDLKPAEPPPGLTGQLILPAQITPLARRAFYSLNATGAVFADRASFQNRDFRGSSIFVGVTFNDVALFHGSRLHQDASFRDATFVGDTRAAVVKPSLPEPARQRLYDLYEKVEREAKREPEVSQSWKAKHARTWAAARAEEVDKDIDGRFDAFEGAFRTLKLSMEANRDRIEEGRFFKLELLARRNRRDKAVPRWERWASYLYEALSDYGNSIARPLAWTFGLMVGMGLVYWGIGALLDSCAVIFVPDAAAQEKTAVVEAQIGTLWLQPLWNGLTVSVHDFFGAMTFSWNNLVRPFSTLSAEEVGPYESNWASAVLYGYGPVWGLLIRVIATLQSLVSIVLIFLFALAMRRRFQIS